MPISARKKLVLFPPIQTFPTNIVSIAAGGITAASFGPGAINAAAIAAGALTAAKFGAGALAGQLVKTMQYGSINIADTFLTNTATLATAVDVTKAALMYLGNQGSDTGAGGRSNFVSITLTNTNTVTANRIVGSGLAIINFVVVEYF